jgi:hypothetical protein
MIKYRQRLTTFTFHDSTRKLCSKGPRSGGPTGGPVGPNGPSIYMLKYALTHPLYTVIIQGENGSKIHKLICLQPDFRTTFLIRKV